MIVLPLAINWLLAIILTGLDGRKRWVAGLGVLGLVASFTTSLWLAVRIFRQGPLQMVTGGWPANIGIALRIDALGVIFLMVANGLLLFALAYELMGGVERASLPAVMLFLATGLSGLFMSGDAFNFYVFFEVSMTASFVLVAYGPEQRDIRNALMFTTVNLLGSVFFLSAIVALYHLTGTLNMREIAIWMDAAEPTSAILTATLIFVAFSLKLGLFPFHFWLPAVYRGVPPMVAAVLSGVLANIGSYGLIRFGADILTLQLEFAATILAVLGVASMLYGAMLALSRTNSSEVLAYSSISQGGYVLLALAIGGSAGVAAALLVAVVNALNKTLLFLASDFRDWLVGGAYFLGALSVAGIPPSAGFFGKAALFRAGAQADQYVLVGFLVAGSALAFVYMFQIYQLQFWRTGDESGSPIFARRILLVVLGLVVLFFGIWPNPLLYAGQQAAAGLEAVMP